MRHVASRQVYDHWSELCRGTVPPDRNDLDPALIAPALQDVFILGCDHSGEWRYRVVGTRLSAFAQRELRNEIFAKWWRAEDRLDINRLLSGTAHDRSPMIGGVSAQCQHNQSHEFEMLLLPLRHGGKLGQRMLGGLFPAPGHALRHDLVIDELAILSLRNLGNTPVNDVVFGQPRHDIAQAVNRRHSLRIIQGGII